jgi:hypothetical protein
MDPLDPRNLEAIKLAYIKSDWSINRIADEHNMCATRCAITPGTIGLQEREREEEGR